MNNQDKTPEVITPNLPLWSYQLQPDSKLAVKTRKDLEIYLITRALKDEGFRQELVANPKAVVEKELGANLPEELEIKVLEETEDTLYMVLPCNPYEGISEDELQNFMGMTYEDVAWWVLEQQRNTFLDDENSVKLMVRSWRDEALKQELALNPSKFIEQALGQRIQENIQFQVCTETVKKLFIVIPSISMERIGEQLAIDEMINMPVIAGSGSGCPSSPPIPFTCGTGANSVGCKG